MIGRVKIKAAEAKFGSGCFASQEIYMNCRSMLLAFILTTIFLGLQAHGAELSDGAMLPPMLRETTIHLLSDNFDDSDDHFRFIELATSSYLVFTEGGVYSLTSHSSPTLKELYRTGDRIEFLQLLYDNEKELACVFAHQNMRAGIISENYAMLQVDKKAGFSTACYLLYTFQNDSENGGNGIDAGEKVDSIRLLDKQPDEEHMLGFNIDCCNYSEGSKWKELVVFKKNQNKFQLLSRRKLIN